MRRWITGLGLLAVLLSACSGQVSQGGNPDVVTTERTAIALLQAQQQVYRVAQPLIAAGTPIFIPAVVGSITPIVGSTVWSCTGVQVSGNTTDRDRDGVPVDATYNGTCSWSYSGNGNTVSGRWSFENVHIQDPDDAHPNAGVKARGKLVWTISATGQPTYTITWEFNKHNFEKKPDSTWGFDYKGRWQVSDGTEIHTLDYELSGTWTPDDPDEPWTAGRLKFSGSFSGSGPSCDRGWSLQASADVHYADCGIDGGSLDLTGTDCDGYNCTLSVIWNGCGNPSLSGGCS